MRGLNIIAFLLILICHRFSLGVRRNKNKIDHESYFIMSMQVDLVDDKNSFFQVEQNDIEGKRKNERVYDFKTKKI